MKHVKLIISVVVVLTGLGTIGVGMAVFVNGAAVADQTGNGGQMGAGAWLILLGLFLALTPPVRLVCKVLAAEHARERAWKASLTPQQRATVSAAETAALTGAAVGGWLANGEWSRRIQERYSETDAAAAAYLASVNGGAGQPGVSAGTPGQPGSGSDPTPRQYDPYGS